MGPIPGMTASFFMQFREPNLDLQKPPQLGWSAAQQRVLAWHA